MDKIKEIGSGFGVNNKPKNSTIKNVKKEEEIFQFSELDFRKIDTEWKEIEETYYEKEAFIEKNYSFYKKIKWGDQDLILNVLRTDSFSEGRMYLKSIDFQLSFHQMSVVKDEEDGLVFGVSDDNPSINFRILLYYRPDKNPSVETSIEKNDPAKKLPLEMAGLIYQKIFEYIQGQANKDQKIYSHRIEKMTSISEQKPLSDERWNEIFIPVIEKGGYEEYGSGGFWVKDYKPE